MAVVSLLVVVLCAALGAQILRWARVEAAGALARWVLGAALGLGILAYAVQAVGLAGLLFTPVILGLLALIALIGLPELARLARDTAAEVGAWLHRPWEPAQWGALALLAPGATIAAVTFLGALSPPGSLDYDSLAYHLAIPRLYLHHHRVFYVDHIWHANIPFTVQMWYTVGLALGGVGGAKLFHWASGILTALAAAVWVARTARVERVSRKDAKTHAEGNSGDGAQAWAPVLAALAFLSIPLGAWEATTGYIDLGTALFLTVAGYALCRAYERRAEEAKSLPDARWAALAGAFAGWAVGTKYSALLQLLLLAAGAAIAAVRWPAGTRGGGSGRFRAVGVFILAGGLVVAPWLIRNTGWTGNPVYPLFYRLFPGTRNWNDEATVAMQREQRYFGKAEGLAAAARSLWDTAFHGREFLLAHRPLRSLRDDKFLGLGIVFVAVLPLAVLVRPPDRRALALILFLLASLAGWIATSQQSRYLLPVFGIGAVAVGLIVPRLPWRSLRAAVIAVVVVQCAGALWGTALLTGAAWPVVLGQSSAADYLREQLGDYYDAAQYTRGLPRGSRIALYQEARGFYLETDYLRANPLHHNLIPYETLPDGDALADFLRDRQRVTHVLINQQGVDADIVVQRWFVLLADACRRGRLHLVWRSARAAADGDLLQLIATRGQQEISELLRLTGRTGRGIVIYEWR
ncbi:MAG: hypothetical protein HY320_15160 [Armatimonadetes bacterium]|nr:hypothetical protein [Armatimonadota bacterium]